MAKVKLTLEGFAAYLEELVRAGADVDAAAGEALEAGADVLVAGMKRRAPFRRIREAVQKTRVYHDGNKVYMYVGVLRDTEPNIVRIANVWEWGGRDTPSPKNRKRKPRPWIIAHPYVRPALRNDAKAAREAMLAVFMKWLKNG